jgi:protein-disulfide isomerase
VRLRGATPVRSRFSKFLLVLVLVGCAAPAPVPPTPTSVPPTPEPTATATPVLEPRTPDGNYFLGHADAPLTLEMFGDFQCPVCREFARTTEPSLMTNYVETGKVKFVWRDFAWIGVESFLAAQAARCAGQQGHFWAFHDYLFAHQQGENLGTFSQQNLSMIAANGGLEPNSFGACMNSGQEPQAIQRAVSFGISLGIDVTPAFLINGDLRIGAPPSSRFPALLESYLARVPH